VEACGRRAVKMLRVGDEPTVRRAEPVEQMACPVLTPKNVVLSVAVEVADADHPPLG